MVQPCVWSFGSLCHTPKPPPRLFGAMPDSKSAIMYSFAFSLLEVFLATFLESAFATVTTFLSDTFAPAYPDTAKHIPTATLKPATNNLFIMLPPLIYYCFLIITLQ